MLAATDIAVLIVTRIKGIMVIVHLIVNNAIFIVGRAGLYMKYKPVLFVLVNLRKK